MNLLKSVLVCVFLLGCSSDNPGNLPSENSETTLSGAGDDLQVLLSSKFNPPGIVGKTLIAISDSAMSKNGWIAASGILEDDLSDELNTLREPAIWRGRDGQLELVMSEDTVIDGFSNADTYSFTRSIEISNDGTIWARIVLDSIEGRIDALVRISNDGQVQGLVKEGGRFNDNEPQLTVDSIGNIALTSDTDKGFVLLTDNNSSRHMVELNPAGVTVLLTSQDFTETVAHRLQGSLSHCVVASRDLLNSFNPPQVTASGDFLMSANIYNEETFNPACPSQAVLGYSNGDLSVRFTTFDTLPGTVNVEIIGLSVVSIAQDGGAIVSISTEEGDERLVNRSTWVLGVDGVWQLLTVENESLPPDFVERMESQPNFESFNRKRKFDFTTGNKFVAVLEDFGIYTGTVRTEQPYESLIVPGASQMNQLISFTDETAANFFYVASYVSIGADGQVWMLANTTSENTGPSEFMGLWRFDENGSGESILTNNSEFSLESETIRLDTISGYSLNDAGGVLIEGLFGGSSDIDQFERRDIVLLYISDI